MNQRDDNSLEQQLNRTRKIASLAFSIAVIALAWAVLAIVFTNHYQTDERRDLRDRLERLERR